MKQQQRISRNLKTGEAKIEKRSNNIKQIFSAIKIIQNWKKDFNLNPTTAKSLK